MNAATRYSSTRRMAGIGTYQVWVTMLSAILTGLVYLYFGNAYLGLFASTIATPLTIWGATKVHFFGPYVDLKILVAILPILSVGSGAFIYNFAHQTTPELAVIFWLIMLLMVPVGAWFTPELKPCNRRTASKLLLQGLLLSGFFWLLFS